MGASVLVQLVVGAVLLAFGRRLFWVFVGGIGFVAGFYFATLFFQDQPDWVVLLLALLAGLLGIGVMIFLQSLAIGIAGFLAGGYLATNILLAFGFPNLAESWIVYIIGGILGVILVGLLFNWGLIILSSLTGAMFIAGVVALPSPYPQIVFIVLVILGVAIQLGLERRYGTVEVRRG